MKHITSFFYICALALVFCCFSCSNDVELAIKGHTFEAYDDGGGYMSVQFKANNKCRVVVSTDVYMKYDAFDYLVLDNTVRVYYDQSSFWKGEARGTLYLYGVYDSTEKTLLCQSPLTSSQETILFHRK